MQKKSLISTLKAVKKANVAAAPAKNQGSVTKKTKVEYIRVGWDLEASTGGTNLKGCQNGSPFFLVIVDR
jgi:hypothetical protein